MPIKLKWHSHLSALVATYAGTITRTEYQDMVKQRQQLIKAQNSPFVFVADVREFVGTSDINQRNVGLSVFNQPNLVAVVFLFTEETHPFCRATTYDQHGHLRAYFVSNHDVAIRLAEQLLD